MHSPLSTGRAAGQHISVFGGTPRSDGGIELAAVYAAGGGARGSGAGTPLAAGGAQQAAGLVAKKNTPASSQETQLLLDRLAADAGSSSGVHLRASYTGGGSGTPNGFSPNAPAAAAVRSRLTSAV